MYTVFKGNLRYPCTEWLAHKNGVNAIGANETALDRAFEGRLFRSDALGSVKSLFACEPLIIAVLRVEPSGGTGMGSLAISNERSAHRKRAHWALMKMFSRKTWLSMQLAATANEVPHAANNQRN